MRLINKDIAPVGGRFYIYEDDKGNEYRTNGYSLTWKEFLSRVRSEMRVNNVTVPDNLEAFVEDQICARQPKGRCYYENKPGDTVSKVIHTFAATADKVAQSLGFNMQVEKKARGCAGCSKRRVKLNG